MLKELNPKKIKYIALHHFGGTIVNRWTKTQHFTEQHIENAHSSRWDFPSQLNGSNIGYNIIVYPNGEWKQYRYVGEETAAQVGYNHNTLSICIAGNFTTHHGEPVESPTPAQVNTLTALLTYAYITYKIPLGNIRAHRDFPHSYTECYGASLSGNWARNLLVPYLKKRLTLLKSLLGLYLKMLSLMDKLRPTKFKGFEKECMGHI